MKPILSDTLLGEAVVKEPEDDPRSSRGTSR